MKTKIIYLAIFFIFSSNIYGYEKRESPIQWHPNDSISKFLIPKNNYDVSKFGHGKYRIDNSEISRGHFNNIYIIFKSNDRLEYAPEKGVDISTFELLGDNYNWRSYGVVIEGRNVIRKELMLPNVLLREEGSKSNYIWIRMDSFKGEYNDVLTTVAEQIILDSLPKK